VPERLDTESMPLTEPHWPPTFDTGPNPQPLATATLESETDEPGTSPDPDPDPDPLVEDPWRDPTSETDVISWSDEVAREPQHVAAPSIVVASQYLYLKRWKFIAVLLGVWIVAAAAGAGLFYWWFHTVDKTWPDFAVLIYVLACVVAALLVSLVEHKPTVSATAIAVMAAPFASGLAAAALYGVYAFGWLQP
jgi:hypothetical protein